MTNFEFYKEEILSMTKDKKDIALKDGKLVACDDLKSCIGCDLDINTCAQSFIKWLYEEYKPKIKLSEREMAFCKAVKTGWLVRESYGSLFYYFKKPTKSKDSSYWSCTESNYLLHINTKIFPSFDFIKWENEEPTSIEEMLKWEVNLD